ncbi:MAG: glycosyltransferase [Paludibacter sp.]|jgi:glycosyltransferase involved in cell wall biosynthesis|nr:glycosyltransferase [Paludibacter sp.]
MIDYNPLLSIIIPVYNVESYIRECLDSLFYQETEFCEIICVNDGSTDNSRVILQEFEAKHSNFFIIDKVNGKQASARNAGLKNAKGSYIYFLDSDDFLYADTLANIKKLIESQCADVYAFNSLINGESKYIANLYILEDRKFSGIEYVRESFKNFNTVATPVWLYVYSRSFLIDNQLYQKEDLYHEDELFTMMVLMLAETLVVKDFSAIYYRWKRVDATTTTNNEKWITDRLIIANELISLYNKSSLIEKAFFSKLFEFLIISVELLYANSYGKIFKCSINSGIQNLMKIVAVNAQELRILRLYKVHPVLMLNYRLGRIYPIIRKLINRFV